MTELTLDAAKSVVEKYHRALYWHMDGLITQYRDMTKSLFAPETDMEYLDGRISQARKRMARIGRRIVCAKTSEDLTSITQDATRAYIRSVHDVTSVTRDVPDQLLAELEGDNVWSKHFLKQR